MTLAQEPITSSDRTVLITFLLARGGHLTVQEVMKLTGLTRCGARRLLVRISFMAPLYENDGVWHMLPERQMACDARGGV